MNAKFKGDRIEFAPNVPAGDWQQIVDYFQSVYHCSRERAHDMADRERKLFFADRKKSRLRFDEANQCWRGRKTKPAYEKFGKRRPGDNPNSLRNVLIREVGTTYLTSEDLHELFEDVYGDEWESKFKQARTKKIVVFNRMFGVWHLWTTRPPTNQTDGMTPVSKRLYYRDLYGDMDGRRHDSDPAKSEVLQFILSRIPGNSLEWALDEFRRARQCGALRFEHEDGMHAKTGLWYGRPIEAEPSPKEDSAPEPEVDDSEKDDALHYEIGDGTSAV